MRGIVYSGNRYRTVSTRFQSLQNAGMEVCNYARLGHTVDKGLADMKRRLTESAEETTVILGFGGNDCDYNWDVVAQNNDKNHLPNTEATPFVATYRACIRHAKSLGAAVYVTNLVPLHAKRFMDHIGQNGRRKAIEEWLGDESMLYRWHEYYHQLVCETAREEEADILDIRTPFLLSRRYETLLGEDGIHPTEEGYRLIEETIESQLLVNTHLHSTIQWA